MNLTDFGDSGSQRKKGVLIKKITEGAIRLGAESLVVIFSILVAFQLEEWRDDRIAFRVETAQLSAIREDLVENQVRLDTVLVRQREVVESARLLVGIHAGALPTPSTDSLVVLTGHATSWWRLEPVMAAYDAMVSSGDVTRLRNRPLLQELASFAGDINVEFEDQSESMSALSEINRIQMEYGTGLFEPKLWDRLGFEGAPSETAVAAIVQDPRYAYLVAVRWALEGNRLELYEQLAEAITRMLSILDAELAERGAT